MNIEPLVWTYDLQGCWTAPSRKVVGGFYVINVNEYGSFNVSQNGPGLLPAGYHVNNFLSLDHAQEDCDQIEANHVLEIASLV